MSEIWRLIPGWTDYEVSSLGRVRRATTGPSTRPGRILTPQPDAHGYLSYMIRRRKVRVSHAVLLAFSGPRPLGTEARHLDDDPSNNAASNLAWGTRLENAADKLRNGGQQRGEQSATAKLTEADVITLRQMMPRPSLRTLAAQYGVSHTAIRRAITGAKWSHVNAG